MKVSQTQNNISTFLLFRIFWFLSLLAFFSGIAVSILTLIIPLLISIYFAQTFGINSYKLRLLGFNFESIFFDKFNILIVFLAVIVLRFFSQFFQNYCSGILGEKIAKYIREKLFDHQMNISMSIYDQRGMGKYILRYTGDLKSIQVFFARGIIQFGVDIFFLILSFVFLIFLNVSIGIVYIVTTISIGFSVILINKRLYEISYQRRDIRNRFVKFVTQRIYAIATIKAFNKQVTEQKKVVTLSSNLYAIGISYQKLVSLLYALTPLLSYGVLLVVLFVISKNIHSNDIQPAYLLTIVLIVMTMYPTLRRFLRIGGVWENGKVSMHKLQNVFKTQTEIEHQDKELQFFNGNIDIKNVFFSYEDKKRILINVSFQIPSNSISLIEGDYGSGKTTLLKLLVGLYSPQKGEILIDSQNINLVTQKSLRRKISIVSDQFPLLGNSVFEAVSYSRKDKNKTAAKTLLDEMQRGLNKSTKLELDDEIGEYGDRLSSGQKKLLMHIRAILTDKPILLIDEPFEGLPGKAKREIAKKINDLSKNKTVIIFSNRSLKKSNLLISNRYLL